MRLELQIRATSGEDMFNVEKTGSSTQLMAFLDYVSSFCAAMENEERKLHRFEGRHDRDCEICGKPDRADIHLKTYVPEGWKAFRLNVNYQITAQELREHLRDAFPALTFDIEEEK